MYLARLLLAIVLILTVAGCGEDVLVPPESEFPEKLSPYEQFFDLATFQQRRVELMARLPADALVVITTNDFYVRNGDVAYEFRPASAFYYLTGFDEPHAVAIIRPRAAGPPDVEMIMFVDQRSDVEMRWVGPSYGPEGAIRYFGADEAYEFAAFGSMLDRYVRVGTGQVVYANLDANARVAAVFGASPAGALEIYDVNSVVDVMRLVKSPIEIQAIKRAADVSVQAFSEAMRMIEPGVYEYEVDALFDYVLRVNGSPRAAFPTIVASGPNSTVLHYDANQRQMQKGELVMIDFGAEYGYYASDVTRTLPVSGVFSTTQGVVYEIVRRAYESVMAAAKPGVSYTYLYELARDVALDGLLDKGIVTGDRDDIIRSGRFRQYIPAGLGHSVGLDVHDPYPMGSHGDKVLQENMVMAIEPHVYLAKEDQTVSAEFRGVSARIEDTVLITAGGVEILSYDLPIKIEEIEARMK